MPVETHLIRVADKATPSQVEAILKSLVDCGARIDVVVQKSIIATFSSDHIDSIRSKPGVLLVGGVHLRGRPVPKVVRRKSE